MREKLVRNTSDERWREFWKAVDTAAANARPLRQIEKSTGVEQRRTTARPKPEETKKHD